MVQFQDLETVRVFTLRYCDSPFYQETYLKGDENIGVNGGLGGNEMNLVNPKDQR